MNNDASRSRAGQPRAVGQPRAAGQSRAGDPSRSGVSPAGNVRLLFVCLGNICRSPTAEGVMRELVRREGLQESIELESAGTGSWHVGSPPDARASAAARARGVELGGTARQVRSVDFADFDLLLAMDRSNLRELRRLAPREDDRAKVRLLREFDPGVGGVQVCDGDLDVPDPYYGVAGGFEEVFDLLQAACEGLLAQIRAGEVP